MFSYSEIEECKALYILETSPLLFSPKVVDTNTKTFRLEIDRDVFVGHPIHIREEDKKKAKQSKKTKKKKRKMTEAIPELHASYSATTSIDKKNVANVSLFNVVFALRYAKDSDKEMNNTYTISDMSKCAEYVMFECEAREFLFILSLSHTDRNSCSKFTIEMHTRILRELISRFALEHRYKTQDEEKFSHYFQVKDR